MAFKKCAWFLLCTNVAATSRAHPVLGRVAICARCDAKVARLMAEEVR